MLRIDPKKLDAVEKWADDEFRSINGQIEWILDQALRKTRRFRKRSSQQTNEDTEIKK